MGSLLGSEPTAIYRKKNSKMTTKCGFLSWNVRGLGTPQKRSQVITNILQTKAQIICLQETHMIPDTTNQLCKPWIQWSIHSSYSTYARGVSLLVHRSVPWKCFQKKVDPEGQYVFVQAQVYDIPFVILGIYNPPPATLSVIKEAMLFASLYPEALVLCLGDFNLLWDPLVDRHGPPLKRTRKPLMFRELGEEFGWRDLWRMLNPQTRAYSWAIPGRGCLSRIDLALENDKIISRVVSVEYLIRGVSDHSPLLVNIAIGIEGMKQNWKFQPYWLSQIGTHDRIPEQLQIFLETHGSQRDLIFWDTLKAYLRGALRSTISYIKRATRQETEDLEEQCRDTEAAFLKTPTEINREKWEMTVRKYTTHIAAIAKYKQFEYQQKYFEQGNTSSRLLAHMAKQQSTSLVITNTQRPDGECVRDVAGIMSCFHSFYTDMYATSLTYNADEISTYLSEIHFPALTTEQVKSLEENPSEEEVRRAITSLAIGKASGPDGLPLEVYSKYVDILAPVLVQVFDAAFRVKRLPESMYLATVVLIPKPDKNLTDCASYRPISLLNTDYKILAKILAHRLNNVILNIIHPDQTGFMPGKSTSINLQEHNL